MFLTKQTVLVFSFSFAKNSVNLSKNYYKVLEVQSGCDQKIIKNSYLKLVKTLHPDVNPKGKDKFTQVQQAYQVLSDQQLKKYYDQNNHYKNGNPNNSGSGPQKHSAQSKSNQAKTGHQYYTHRTYASQNPHDYFYTDNEPKQQKKNSQNRKQSRQQYDEEQEEMYKNNNSSKPNQRQKRSKSEGSWEQYQRQKQYQQQKQFARQTPQQRQMRDRIKSMRGFTSSYNALWGRHHIRYTDILGRDEWQKKRQEQLKNLMPQKVRKFYDKLIDKLQKIAEK